MDKRKDVSMNTPDMNEYDYWSKRGHVELCFSEMELVKLAKQVVSTEERYKKMQACGAPMRELLEIKDELATLAILYANSLRMYQYSTGVLAKAN